MTEPDTVATVNDFIARINAADADGLAALMTDDFTFVDYFGDEFAGRDVMRDGFRRYFEQYPGYRIVTEQVLVCGAADVLVIGRAVNSHIPAAQADSALAWHAIVREDLVAVWRIFAPAELVEQE
jgi:uncharacterized protein (TIGR02246 family)